MSVPGKPCIPLFELQSRNPILPCIPIAQYHRYRANFLPVGLTIPKLLPITGSFALPLSAYYIFLQGRVSYLRVCTEEYIDGSSSSSGNEADHTKLRAASRSQANFAENVPLALALATIVELNGGSRKTLTAALSALVVFRVLHAELGIMAEKAMGIGRPIGFFGTQGVVAGLAGYAAYLVKGYWDL